MKKIPQEKLKVLYVTQEITPYMPETEMSLICRYLPQGIQESGREIRTFMPKFGIVNERRNQLHEVIRLSGMNLVINDNDYSLIIKVASIQPARIQIYFIDNEDYFWRKHALVDSDTGEEFEDNDERAVFYSRGVIETVKKIAWAPNLVHCHGWFTALIPFYLRKIYGNDPLFDNNYKIIYSIYNDGYQNPLSKNLSKNLLKNNVPESDIIEINEASWLNLTKFAIRYSDAIILASNDINSEIKDCVYSSKKPFIENDDTEDYVSLYNQFYDSLLEK